MCDYDLRAHLYDDVVPMREPPSLSPFRPGYETFATGSDSGWGGSPAPEHPNRDPRAWGSPPPGASENENIGGAVQISGGGDCQETVEEEEGNDIIDTVKALSGFSLKEEVLEVEQAAPAAEEALAQAAAAEEVLD